MAETNLNIELDTKEVIQGKFNLNIHIQRVAQWQWRINLAILLCRLAAKIAWLDWSIVQAHDLWTYQCPNCGLNVPGKKVHYPDELAINCRHCNYQFLAIWGAKEQHPIIGPEDYEFTCGYECAYARPYGFVPEVGCPVHD